MQTLFKTILVGLAAILVPTMMAHDFALSAAQAPKAAAVQPVRVLAFGDSLTQGYGPQTPTMATPLAFHFVPGRLPHRAGPSLH